MRRKAGLFLAPVIFVVLLLYPFRTLSPDSHKLAAVIGCILILWITEALPLPVTGLLGPTLAILLGIAPASKAFGPFADSPYLRRGVLKCCSYPRRRIIVRSSCRPEET